MGTKNISTHLGSLIKNAHKEGQEDPGTMVLYPMDFITQWIGDVLLQNIMWHLTTFMWSTKKWRMSNSKWLHNFWCLIRHLIIIIHCLNIKLYLHQNIPNTVFYNTNEYRNKHKQTNPPHGFFQSWKHPCWLLH